MINLDVRKWPRRYLTLLFIAVAIGVVLLADWLAPLITPLVARVFPKDVALYVYEERSGADFSKDLLLLYPAQNQRHDGIRVVVLNISKADLVDSVDQLMDRHEKLTGDAQAKELFFKLNAPYSESKESLRQSIDSQSRFTGHARVQLLDRVVMVVGARDTPKANACTQLRDDWAYADWQYGGFALSIDNTTVDLLRPCLAALILENKSSVAARKIDGASSP
jgi:hypothetical protein